jgi:hypothetical protein
MLQLTNMINLGHIVTTKGDRFPGEIAYGIPFASVKSGLAAFYLLNVPNNIKYMILNVTTH